MNPRLVGLVLAVQSLWPTSASASLFDDWISVPYPYHRDTVDVTILSSTAYRTMHWTVDQRDEQGRPLHATRVRFDFLSESYPRVVDEFSWTWTFDRPGSYLIASSRWPARIEIDTRDSTGLLESQATAIEWLAASRSIVMRSNFLVAPCPWSDSIVYDERDRRIQQVSCRLRVVNDDSSIVRRTRTWFYESTLDTAPRWITEHPDDSTLPSDSVHIEGPVTRPILARIVRRDPAKPADTLPRIDSLRWDDQGHLLSRTFWNPSASAPSSLRKHWSEEYTWQGADLLSAVSFFWSGDTARDRYEVNYSYPASGTSVSPRSPRTTALRRTAGGRVSLTLPTSGPARVEWIAPDGRRVLLHDGPAPQGTLDLPVPRGVGFLRVRQGGQTRTHALPSL